MHKRQLFSLMSTIALALALAAASGSVRAAEESTFPGVEKLMSAEEFSASGLEKLSPAEVKELNRWLIRYTATDAEFIQVTDTEVKEAKKEAQVTARLSENFKGWSGKTRFHLDNGQVWQQRMGGSYHYRGEPPQVQLKQNLFGFWTMTLVDQGVGVGVKRIR